MESFEKVNEVRYGYKYDFLADRFLNGDNDEVGFIPHCDRPDWDEKEIVKTPSTPLSIPQYGKITRITHLHKKCKIKISMHEKHKINAREKREIAREKRERTYHKLRYNSLRDRSKI